jgi:hypothetical protein
MDSRVVYTVEDLLSVMPRWFQENRPSRAYAAGATDSEHAIHYPVEPKEYALFL